MFLFTLAINQSIKQDIINMAEEKKSCPLQVSAGMGKKTQKQYFNGNGKGVKLLLLLKFKKIRIKIR